MVIIAVGLQFEARIAARAGMRVVCGREGQKLSAALACEIARGCSGLISFGLAGGLSPKLRPGTCIVGSTIFSDADQYVPDRDWSDSLLNAIPGAVHGMLVGVAAPVAEPDAKRALFLKTHAVAVDMESHIVARVAAAHSLPMVAVRVITDPVERRLPQAALAGMRLDGTIDAAAVICSLVKNPADILAMVRTAVDARLGRSGLLLCSHSLGLGFNTKATSFRVPPHDSAFGREKMPVNTAGSRRLQLES
jgi:adenosylhomocysteine nucleosidase